MRTLLLGALLLASTAHAQGTRWEYLQATFRVDPLNARPVEISSPTTQLYTYETFGQLVIKTLKLSRTALDLNTTDYLNYFGAQGWEVVTVTHVDYSARAGRISEADTYLFKRPLR